MKKVSVFNYTFQNASASTCDVYIDGIIIDEESRQFYEDWFGDTTSVSYKSVRTSLEDAISKGCKTINIYVNSGGGNVVEAMALCDYFTAIEAKGITVNRIGRGLIASAATFFLMGNNSFITENSWFMIHNVSGLAYGSLQEVDNYARTMRKFNDKIVEFYTSATGMTKDEIESMMNEETWMSGTEAHALKFVKNIEKSQNFQNEIKPSQWMWNNTEVLKAYNSSIKIPINMDANTIKNIVNGVKDAFMNSLKEAGIIKDENTKMCETLTNALDKALEPMNDGINSAITDAVDKAVEDKLKDLSETVKNEVAEATKGSVTIQDVEEKLKPIKDDLIAVQDKVLDNAGGSAKGERSENGGSPENMDGVSWS